MKAVDGSKVCSGCHKEKPLAEFSKNKSMPDGYQHYCKQCRYEYDKKKYAEDPSYREMRRGTSRRWKKKVGYKTPYQGAEIGRARQQKYRDTHPGYNSQQHNNRRARKLNNGGSYTKEELMALYESQGGRCLGCGRLIRLEADHVIPLSRGGSNSIDNIQGLCRTCNGRKYNKIIDYRQPFVAMAT